MDAKEFSAAMQAHLIEVHDSTTAVNAARDTLSTVVHGKLANLAGRQGSCFNPYDPGTWGGIIDGATPLDNFQAHTCRWRDVGPGQAPPRLRYNVGHIRKQGDSGGALHAADRSQWPTTDARLATLVNDYFCALFQGTGPLSALGQVLDEIDQTFRQHCVTMSVDFYYSRPLKQQGLHKDTTGNTLFVGLHYNNKKKMVGPEFFYDFWPIPSVDQLDEDGDTSEARIQCPWAKDDRNDDVRYWPEDLVTGLEHARGKIKKTNSKSQDLLRITTLEPDGLITFVDELIYHQTPLTRYRDAKIEEDATTFGYVKIEGKSFKLSNWLPPQKKKATPVLRRQFSEQQMEDQWSSRAVGPGGRRSFLRFWVMVEPKAWLV